MSKGFTLEERLSFEQHVKALDLVLGGFCERTGFSQTEELGLWPGRTLRKNDEVNRLIQFALRFEFERTEFHEFSEDAPFEVITSACFEVGPVIHMQYAPSEVVPFKRIKRDLPFILETRYKFFFNVSRDTAERLGRKFDRSKPLNLEELRLD